MPLNADSHILVIDDYALARFMVREALKELGMKSVLEARNGEEGLNILNYQVKKGAPVELVISDMNMPVMSGLELLKYVRSSNEFRNLPFVILTVEAAPTSIETITQAGATDYFIKPFSLPIINKKLAELIKKISK